MPEQRGPQQNPLLSLPAMLLVLAAAGGYFRFKPLESDRPDPPEQVPRLSFGPETEPARLWQDPLAVRKGSGPSGNAVHHSEFVQSIRSHLRQAGQRHEPSVWLLPVMITSGEYANDRETRLRTRYAVLSALGEAGYLPKAPEHIGRFALSRDQTSVPYAFEWLRHAHKPKAPLANVLDVEELPEYIAVLWMPDEGFASRPLTRMAETLHKLFDGVSSKKTRRDLRVVLPDRSDRSDAKQQGGPGRLGFAATLRRALSQPTGAVALSRSLLAPTSATESENPEGSGLLSRLTIKVIGPRTSASLRSAIREVVRPVQERSANRGVTTLLDGIEVYSPWSTVPIEWMVKDLQGSLEGKLPKAGDDLTATLCKEYGVRFRRTVRMDGSLVTAILEELRRRGIRPRTEPHHLVVVGDWDTYYGRVLARLVKEKVKKAEGKATGQKTDASAERVHIFHYMRGLDGRTPRDERKAAAGRAGGASSSGGHAEAYKDPVGKAQFDYLRRLAERVASLESRLAREDEGEIRAIGVVGADVYDKLLILQALRQQLPSRYVFFTTDLDARLAQENHLKWTRNLLVASSFGLKLRECYQPTVPPLRSSYQTAMYSAVLAALGARQLEWTHWKDRPVRLFEIANHGPYDITPVQAAHDDPDGEGDTPVHPARSDLAGPATVAKHALAATALAVLLLVVLSPFFFTVRRWLADAIPGPGAVQRPSLGRLFSRLVLVPAGL